MKKLYSTAIIILTASFALANPVINAANSGNWKNNATWNLNRLPLNGDTVIIPSGKTVVVDDFENLGNDWNTIENIAAAGNTTVTHSYSFTDKNVISKVAYYRIPQVDIDGRVAFIPERMIINENSNAGIRVSTTSSNSIYVNFSDQAKANVIVCLTAANGQLVSQKTFDEPIGQMTMPIQHAVKGIYFVSIIEGQDLKFSKQVLL